LLEALAEAGKAPDVSIISLDHPEIQFFGYPYWSTLTSRVTTIFDDVTLFYARTEGGYRDVIDTIKIFKNSIEYTWSQAKEIWSYDSIRRYFNIRRTNTTTSGTTADNGNYRLDGSTFVPPVLSGVPIEFKVRRALSPMSNSYLENALIRLNHIVREYGLKVVIYESPIAPVIDRELFKVSSPHAQITRERTLSVCAEVGLDCRAAPVISAPKNGPFWGDCCHAPSSLLAPYIRSLINDARHSHNAVQ